MVPVIQIDSSLSKLAFPSKEDNLWVESATHSILRKSRYKYMLMSPQTATAAVAIIKSLAPNESVLVLRRASHPQDPWSGHFSFPGGRSEKKDNNLLSTCIRETREETGIPLDAGQLQQRLP